MARDIQTEAVRIVRALDCLATLADYLEYYAGLLSTENSFDAGKADGFAIVAHSIRDALAGDPPYLITATGAAHYEALDPEL